MTTKGKKILLLVISTTILLFATVVGFMIYSSSKKMAQEKNDTNIPPAESVVVTTTGTKTKEPDPTEGWKTVKVESHNLQFKYPEKLGNPEKEEHTPSEMDIVPSVKQQIVRFTGSNATKVAVVDVISIADYKKNNQFAEKLATIKNIYEKSSAEGAEELTATFINAATLASTSPQYIETADKKYRGIYYFANIGQANTTELSSVIVMTDNKNIVQFIFTHEADNASQYETDLYEPNSALMSYVKSLTENSNETVARNFKETYKLMAQSLEEL